MFILHMYAMLYYTILCYCTVLCHVHMYTCTLYAQSVWGGLLDPLADKVFIGCLGVGLVLQGLLPSWLLGVILGRDVFLVACAAGFRALERPQGAPFFDSETATFEIVPTYLSKVSE